MTTSDCDPRRCGGTLSDADRQDLARIGAKQARLYDAMQQVRLIGQLPGAPRQHIDGLLEYLAGYLGIVTESAIALRRTACDDPSPGGRTDERG